MARTRYANIVLSHSPVDWKIRDAPPDNNRFGIQYPFILGADVAGEVLHVGAGVTAFKKGDRVLAHAMSLAARDTAYGGFQLYVKLKVATVARIPPSLGMSYASAAVLPLSVSTAAAGLYMRAALGLDLPAVPTLSRGHHQGEAAGRSGRGSQVPVHENDKVKKTLLLWGGSSSVGSSVVQLAVASGYRVIATASPANYKYVKSLGASYVLDYHNPDVVGILTLLLRGCSAELVGVYDAIGTDTTVRQCGAVAEALGGGRVASVGVLPEGSVGKGVEVVRVGSTGIVSAEPDVAKRVWGEYVPVALETGALKPAPRETVVGQGLYYCQGACDLNKRGVSAAKVVVEL